MTAMRQSFRPEFINRVDEFVIFNSLAQKHLREIVAMELARLSERGSSRFAKLTATDEALDFIANVGFDSVYGARPLKRTIQREVETPLAKLILSGKVNASSKLQVDVVNDRLVVNDRTSV